MFFAVLFCLLSMSNYLPNLPNMNKETYTNLWNSMSAYGSSIGKLPSSTMASMGDWLGRSNTSPQNEAASPETGTSPPISPQALSRTPSQGHDGVLGKYIYNYNFSHVIDICLRSYVANPN